jgi:hypothetical protein
MHIYHVEVVLSLSRKQARLVGIELTTMGVSYFSLRVWFGLGVCIIQEMAEATMYQMYLYHLLLDLRLTGKQPRSDGIELTNMLVNLISVRGQSRVGDGNI